MKQGASQFWLTGTIALCCLATAGPTRAQIVPDATLPNNSQVTTQGNTSLIEGGTAAGTNLFHSFRDFSVTAGTEVYFNNSSNIQNIITRVTGNSVSNIDGLLRANGTANLFLINPNGILFGPNASLQIGGSFLASTADRLVFEDGSVFSARNPQASPLLTVNVPIGLQFGTNSGKITNRSQASIEGFTNSVGLPIGLTVIPGQTLALVGGDISLENGNLTAFDGRIELGSVVDSGYVSLTPLQSGWALGYENVQNFGNIQLSQESVVDASVFDPGIGSRSGEINVNANQLILNNSGIATSNFSSLPGGSLNVNASFVELSGTLTAPINPDGIPAGLFSQTEGEGAAGNLTIQARELIIRDGSAVSTDTFNSGSGGNLTVTASEFILLSGSAGENLDSSLSAQTNGTGEGGKLTITTRQLSVQEGSQITSSTYDAGKAGDLFIQAFDSVEVSGIGGIAAQVNPEATGSGGKLTIATRELQVQNNASISARTAGSGDAGNVEINAQRIILQSGGQIIADTAGTGRGGTLNVNASESVEIFGTGINRPSGLITQSKGFFTESNAGDANDLMVTTRRLILQDGAAISADTFADGNGGSIKINASDSVELIGRSLQEFNPQELPSVDPDGRLTSRIAAFSRGSGDAGSLEINTNQLIISNGATATVSSSLSTGAAAGNLNINSPEIRLDTGIITAETRAGSEGNIFLQTQDLQLRRNSNITTNATGPATGGNIFINTDTIAALENSDISANAEQDFGGKVQISTQGIFRQGFLGTDVNRDSSAISSDITATSQLGPEFDGTVAITNPDIDPAQGLVDLPEDFAQDEIPENACAAAGKGSQFINSGRGGLPPNPREALNLGVFKIEEDTGRENASQPAQLVEAQGWIIDENNVVHLVVQSPKTTPSHSWETPAADCRLQSTSYPSN